MVRAVVIDPKTNRPFVDEISPWPDLPTLQRRVGGYVELVCPPSVQWHAYVAEAGKQRGLPYNSLATDLARDSDPEATELYGTVLIVGTGGLAGERTGKTEEAPVVEEPAAPVDPHDHAAEYAAERAVEIGLCRPSLNAVNVPVRVLSYLGLA